MRRHPFHWKDDCGEPKEKRKVPASAPVLFLSVLFFSFPVFVLLAKALIHALSSTCVLGFLRIAIDEMYLSYEERSASCSVTKLAALHVYT
jgi:hypothetical protein